MELIIAMVVSGGVTIGVAIILSVVVICTRKHSEERASFDDHHGTKIAIEKYVERDAKNDITKKHYKVSMDLKDDQGHQKQLVFDENGNEIAAEGLRSMAGNLGGPTGNSDNISVLDTFKVVKDALTKSTALLKKKKVENAEDNASLTKIVISDADDDKDKTIKNKKLKDDYTDLSELSTKEVMTRQKEVVTQSFGFFGQFLKDSNSPRPKDHIVKPKTVSITKQEVTITGNNEKSELLSDDSE